MATIKNSNDDKCCCKSWKLGRLIHSWWGSKSVQPLWKLVCKFLKKKERNLLHDLTILLFRINLNFVTYSLDMSS